MAVLVEVVQPWFGRSGDWEDLGWGVAGVMTGALWSAAAPMAFNCKRTALQAAAVLGMLLPPAAWLAEVAMAWRAADTLLPVLTNYRSERGGFFWTAEPYENPYERQMHDHGEMVLERHEKLPASAHLDARGRDWTKYTGVEIDGTLECSTEVVLGLRLDLNDAKETRLRAGGRLQPGRQRLFIPWPDSSPPREVRQLVVFLAAGSPTARLHIHELRLAADH
ncbi:MAG: hypothetical protein R3F13_06200 [Prosthecobacter sp.]